MKNRKKSIVLISFCLLLSCLNYSRIEGMDNIRAIEFISIFAIGALSSLLIREIVIVLKNR